MPVDLPQGVTATIGAEAITLKGAKGSLTLPLKGGVKVVQQDKHLEVQADTAGEGMNAIAGATRAHLANMVTGVTKGYEKKLELVGVGYRAAVQGKDLVLALGYTHDIKYPIPAGVTMKTEKPTSISITGANKQQIGQIAAEIRAFRPPEPYKGKGVKYVSETIVRKEGKKK